jgi:hypothetical protein
MCGIEVPERPHAPVDLPCLHCGCLSWFERDADGRVIPFEREMIKAGAMDEAGAWAELYRFGLLVLDFRAVTFFESAVLGRLIRVKQRLGPHGRLKVRLHPDMVDTFRITRLDQIFDIESAR